MPPASFKLFRSSRTVPVCRLSALLRQPSRRESVALPQRAASRVWQLIPPQRSIAEPATIRCAKPGNGARASRRSGTRRHFARPEVASQLRRQARALRAEQRAARRAERQVREQAKVQAALARARARQAAAHAQLPRRSDPQAAWLDERDQRLPLLRADLHSANDHAAARAVADGGGLQAVIEATGLRTLKNALRLVDPAILVRAFDNDAAARAGLAERARLRRLVPDRELVKRRAAGEPLRRIAADYHVAHTTLSRWFARPEIARRLRANRRRRPPTSRATN